MQSACSWESATVVIKKEEQMVPSSQQAVDCSAACFFLQLPAESAGLSQGTSETFPQSVGGQMVKKMVEAYEQGLQ